MSANQRNHLVTCLLLSQLMLTACTSTENILAQDHFDAGSGANITVNNAPWLFYKPAPLLAVNAYDFIELGPIEISRGGTQSNWIWIALWSSIDRGLNDSAIVTPELESVLLWVDGEPMELKMRARQPGLSPESQPYQSHSQTARSNYFDVSADQLARISAARELRITLSSTSVFDGEYTRWKTGAN